MHKKVEAVMHRILHVMEFVIAMLTLVVLIGMLGLEIYKMFTVADYFSTLDNFLHNILHKFPIINILIIQCICINICTSGNANQRF